MALKIVIVGAGPIGLEAALRAIHDGFDVTVLEQGSCVGHGVRRWQHVRLFSPFGMNASDRGLAVLNQQTESNALPAADAILTGQQFCGHYLQPLAATPKLTDRIRFQHRVVAVSRDGLHKGDLIGKPSRNVSGFRILCSTPNGESIHHADLLIDCTGFTERPRPAGAGGIYCPGEHELLNDANYRIPDVAGASRQQFANRHTLVIGSGYSAATSLSLLTELAKSEADTKITWLTRSNNGVPIEPVADDPLQERKALTDHVNRVALTSDRVTWFPRVLVDRIERSENRYLVRLMPQTNSLNGSTRPAGDIPDEVVVDQILVHTGIRPDTRPFDELQIHRCYATEGPIKLAAHLLGQSSSDCLQQSTGDAELLRNPEPGFFVLGAASYGRNGRFLLRNGIAQVEQLFDHLSGDRKEECV